MQKRVMIPLVCVDESRASWREDVPKSKSCKKQLSINCFQEFLAVAIIDIKDATAKDLFDEVEDCVASFSCCLKLNMCHMLSVLAADLQQVLKLDVSLLEQLKVFLQALLACFFVTFGRGPRPQNTI